MPLRRHSARPRRLLGWKSTCAMPEQCAQWQEPDGLVRTPLRQADIADSMRSAQAMVWDGVWQRYRDAPLRLPPTAITEYAVVLTADSILARSTRRRQTSTGWNTAYIGANRYTLPRDEKPPADDALHPMAFLVEKGPGGAPSPGRTSTKLTNSRWSLPVAACSN